MEQKEVKIIGLAINQQLGILEAAKLEFSPENNLIPIHGEVGAGKTTLQRGLSLVTQGSDTLKADKNLYGQIDLEVQLLDGETPVFVGCKSTESGALDYVLYTKGPDGKKTENPIIDGEKATPAKYLKLLQTKLTWRLDELISESPTVQKRILLDVYRPELSKIGIVFDKKNEAFSGSILDQIEKAESKRTEADFYRKQKGGFSKHLLEVGVNTDRPETVPARMDADKINEEANRLKYEITNFFANFDKNKNAELLKVKNKALEITAKLKEENAERERKNSHNEALHIEAINELDATEIECNRLLGQIEKVEKRLKITLTEARKEFNAITFPTINDFKPVTLLSFNSLGQCTETVSEAHTDEINDHLEALALLRVEALAINGLKVEAGPEELEAELRLKESLLKDAKENNLLCDACDTFYDWQEKNIEVLRLKNNYFQMLTSINTGVEGLRIVADENENIYLEYNGQYDPDYFGNPTGEFRKLSSYSDTQKPLICLLVQGYLLGQKSKAMRYLWIDKIPIDKKTKNLLEKMGQNLGLTIFVNITGDFEKSDLKKGEILINNGHLFY